jgi:predicted SAM-dependent methyltransferase
MSFKPMADEWREAGTVVFRTTPAESMPRHNPHTRNVLHTGCGTYSARKLHPIFGGRDWRETRLDVDGGVQPDIVCSVHDMTLFVLSEAYDAVWSSHHIEHLHAHEVPLAFKEICRVLKADGFALFRCPDLESVAETLLRDGPDHTAYLSPAGPISALDMLYGHGASIADGQMAMRHHTGFTADRLGRLLIDAGFGEVHTKRAADFDLWAVAFMEKATPAVVLAELARCGVAFDRES